jgi:hypothetical protein
VVSPPASPINDAPPSTDRANHLVNEAFLVPPAEDRRFRWSSYSGTPTGSNRCRSVPRSTVVSSSRPRQMRRSPPRGCDPRPGKRTLCLPRKPSATPRDRCLGIQPNLGKFDIAGDVKLPKIAICTRVGLTLGGAVKVIFSNGVAAFAHGDASGESWSVTTTPTPLANRVARTNGSLRQVTALCLSGRGT